MVAELAKAHEDIWALNHPTVSVDEKKGTEAALKKMDEKWQASEIEIKLAQERQERLIRGRLAREREWEDKIVKMTKTTEDKLNERLAKAKKNQELSESTRLLELKAGARPSGFVDCSILNTAMMQGIYRPPGGVCRIFIDVCEGGRERYAILSLNNK